MIIDAHNHPDWLGHDFKQQIENMNSYGINKTWILSWECPEDEYDPIQNHLFHENMGVNGASPAGFERCLSYYRSAPDRFILGFAPDPRRPSSMARLKAAISLYGVKIYGEVKVRMMYDNPDAIAMFRFCGEQNLPVVLHFENPFDTGRMFPRPNYWYGGDMDTLERVLVQCPETKFLAHALGFWANISADDQANSTSYPTGPVIGEGKVVKLMRKYSNLYADMSANSGVNALTRDLNFTRHFLTEFQDRVVYSRDCFHNKHQQLLNSLGLSEDILQKIYCGNALSLIHERS